MKFNETIKLTHFEWNYIRNLTLIGLMKLLCVLELKCRNEIKNSIRPYLNQWNWWNYQTLYTQMKFKNILELIYSNEIEENIRP